MKGISCSTIFKSNITDYFLIYDYNEARIQENSAFYCEYIPDKNNPLLITKYSFVP